MSIKFCKNEGHGEMHLENSLCMHQGNLDSNTADERLTDAYAAASKGSVPEKKVVKSSGFSNWGDGGEGRASAIKKILQVWKRVENSLRKHT